MGDNLKEKKQMRMPKHTNEMSKGELEETLKLKKECNARALQIVEWMVEVTVDKDWFLENLKYIRQNHFEDVIEERAIMKVCGYPLCSEKLQDIPSHQYHISVKSKKVYDITERKKFCSNFCYKAANYLEEQLLTSPLWFLDVDEKCNFKIMTNDLSGIVGKEISVEQDLESKHKHLKKESEFLSINQFALESLVKISPESTSPIEKDKHNELIESSVVKPHGSKIKTESKVKTESKYLENLASMTDTSFDHENNSCREPIYKSVYKMDRDVIDMDIGKSAALHNECIAIRKPCSKIIPNKEKVEKNIAEKSKISIQGTETLKLLRPAQRIEKCLNEWFNLETVIHLFGETKTKELILASGKSIKECNAAFSNSSRDSKLTDRYDKICQRLNVMELEDVQFDENLKGISQLKPLPDYQDIQEAGRKMELKVNAFYQGRTVFTETPTTSSQAPPEDLDSLVPDNLMPLVDLHSQKALRRRIVIDKLKKVLSDLLRTFGITSLDIISDVRALVNTFSLEAHNITFRPAEWTLLGLIIIKILEFKNSHISVQLRSKQARKHHAAILTGFQEKTDYIEQLISHLTDIDNLLKS